MDAAGVWLLDGTRALALGGQALFNFQAPDATRKTIRLGASVMSRPRVSPRILARDVSLDGRSPNSKMWGPPTAKRFKMVKMCPRKECGLEPQRCFCLCKECQRPLKGLKRCGRSGCPFGANRSPEVETPPPESPPRARLPSMNPSLLSRWPYDRPPPPDHWINRCPCEQCPFYHFRPHVVMGVSVWHAAYRTHRAAGILPGHPLWGLSPAERKNKLLELRQQREHQVVLQQLQQASTAAAQL